MELKIPELSLILMMGASSSGKSSFAKKHFKSTEIISSDYCRALVSDDENNMESTADAFELLHFMVSKRLKRGLLTVVDATNVQHESRKSLIDLAKKYHVVPVIIGLNMREKDLKERHAMRTDRVFNERVISNQVADFRSSLKHLRKEGFRYTYILNPSEIDAAVIRRELVFNNKKELKGPFDIIGDVHGCFDELMALLAQLNYKIEQNTEGGYSIENPEKRIAIFIGDLVDRGPKSPEVLELVMQMVKENKAICVPGNHDDKLKRWLEGRAVQLQHGLETTVEQLLLKTPEFREECRQFIDKLISHYVLDGGKLVVAHAGLREDMQGRASAAVRSFCLYGETTGEIDEFGLPVRHNWAAEYKGKAMVIYGHTPVPQAEWLNNTMDIDTGCVFGGKLSALRYPEREVVSVEAKAVYAIPRKPFLNNIENIEFTAPLSIVTDSKTLQQKNDDLLDILDVLGKNIIETRLMKNIIIREENAVSALEVMSRFAINPKWLIYLPPTMSPSETSQLPDYLEHPKEAFEYFLKNGVTQVICEEKHMGSRAVVILCKNKNVAIKRFGTVKPTLGTVYTRTGRAFFNDENLENQFLDILRNALEESAFWTKFNTDWVALDCELMPWSAKALGLIQNQYAATGASAKHALSGVLNEIQTAKKRNLNTSLLENIFQKRSDATEKFIKSYQNYCVDANAVDDLVLAPFHILATEGVTHTDKNHVWHIENIAELCKADKKHLLATPFRVVNLMDEIEKNEAINWWLSLTESGGEGMVIKPLDFIQRKTNGEMVQPAIKCRGREYLRIIYGAEYTLEKNLIRLKERGLSKKRSMALREFALGVESLERFNRNEPLRKIHECVFGVLALESDEIDPRL